MLVVQLKPEDELQLLIASKKLLVIECLGCKDVLYPLEQIDSCIKGLNNELVARIQLDYLCNRVDKAKKTKTAVDDQVLTYWAGFLKSDRLKDRILETF